MYDICFCKFSINLDLKEKLLGTEGYFLEEGNTWGDKTWGKVNGKGENRLGLILMLLREQWLNHEISSKNPFINMGFIEKFL